MTFVPVNAPAVLSLDEDTDMWLGLLRDEDPKSTLSTCLPSLSFSEYAGKERCLLCWESKPVVYDDKIDAYFTGCGHGCCYECLLRWVFLCSEKRCPICLANEMTSKIDLKRVNNLKDNRGSDDIALLHLSSDQPNDQVVFTRKRSSEEMTKCVLRQEAEMQPFFNWNGLKFFANSEEGDIPKCVIRLLSIECKDCGRSEEVYNLFEKEYSDFHFISDHTKSHNQILCELCFFKGTKLTNEFQVFGLQSTSLGDHLMQFHHKCTLCAFTRYFYSKDDLINHCRGAHHFCHVCDSTDLFFPTGASLFEHVTSQHFVCEHCPKGVRHLVAFKTVLQLLEHHVSEHPMVDVEKRFMALFSVGHNLLECEDTTTRRDKLDKLDGLLRKLFAQGKLNIGPLPRQN